MGIGYKKSDNLIIMSINIEIIQYSTKFPKRGFSMRYLMWFIALVLFAGAGKQAGAQLDASPVIQPGAYLQNGQKTEFAGWIGFESSLLGVPDRGFSAVSRAGLFYVDIDDDIQGFSIFIAGKKNITCDYAPSIYGLIGGGLIYQILEGYDSKDAALKVELGIEFRSGS